MSDQFYAVEFRSMHTGCHNIAVFSLESEAQWFFNLLDNSDEIPEDYQFDENNFVGFEEINFRDKPYDAFGMEILYMNEWETNGNRIPDVYNY
jgi:hypothetical protein